MKKGLSLFLFLFFFGVFTLQAQVPECQIKVAILAGTNNLTWDNDVKAKLLSTGKFSEVDILNFASVIPTLATLQPYDAILVYVDAPGGSISRTTQTGNVVASYIETGGGVVIAAFGTSIFNLKGNFITAGYELIIPKVQAYSIPESMGAIFIPAHPILNGVNSFYGGGSSFRANSTELTSGSVLVANWTDGLPLVVVKENVGPAGANRADLNMFPPSDAVRSDFWDATTDGALLMANALVWTSQKCQPPIIADQTRSLDADKCFYTAVNGEFDPDFGDDFSATQVNSFNGQATLNGAEFPAGLTSITWTASDDAGSTTSLTFTVLVTKRPTVLTYSGDTDGEYSEPAMFSALLTDQVSGLPLTDKTIKFTFGTKFCSVKTNDEGIAGCGFNLAQNPCDKTTWTVKAEFEEDCNFLGSTDEEGFTYTPEDAVIIEYTGTNIAATKGQMNIDFSVVLRAVIREDPDEEYLGDISEAKARFIVNGTDESGLLPVMWADMGDHSAGVVEFLWEDALVLNPTTYDIKIELDGCAYKGFSIDYPLTIYNSVGDFITGGGHMILTDAAAGAYAPSPDSKTNFGFNVKFNKRGTNLQGKMNIIYRVLDEMGEVETVYQIKSNAATSLGTNVKNASAKIAEFVSKANLIDVTDPMSPVEIGGNLNLHVTMTDYGEPGVNDMIGFSLFNGDPKLDPNALWMSSNWVFPETVEQVIDGGNLLVHTAYTIVAIPNNEEETPPIGGGGKKKAASLETGETLFEAYPNPFIDRIVFEFSPAVTGKARIEILDLNGRLIRTLFDQTVETGNNYQATFEPGTAVDGLYLYRATIGNDVKFGKILKR